MRRSGRAARLTIYLGESHQWHHRPVYMEVVHRALEAELAGAAVFRGVEGFGQSLHIHTSRLLSLSEDLPVAVVIIDEEERLRRFLDQVDEVIGQGLAVLDEVEVMQWVREPASREHG